MPRKKQQRKRLCYLMSFLAHSIYEDEIGDSEIRLLDIRSPPLEEDGSLISCRLVTFPAASCPDYTCLSYAWLEPLANRTGIDWVIRVNGVKIKVRSSLAAALHQYADAVRDGYAIDYKPTWFWIDALCIDQDSVVERTAQVSVMHRIYRRAWKALIWLGPDPHNEAQRQEVALAEAVEFWCGSVQFTLLELAEVSRFHSLSGLCYTLNPLRHGVQIPDKIYEGRAVGGTPIRFLYMRDKVAGVQRWESNDELEYGDRLTGPARTRREGRAGMDMLRIFACHLHLCLTTDASGVRDKVFSLLSLMKQVASAYGYSELPLSIDYTKSMADVFREVTAWVIEESGWLGIFALVNQRRTVVEDQEKGMPTWVIDFSAVSPKPLEIDCPWQHRLVKATELLTNMNRPKVSGSILAISIKRIGTVIHVGNSHNEMIDDGKFDETAKLLLRCPPLVSSKGKTLIDWFMDTLLGRHRVQTCDDQLRKDFSFWLKFFHSPSLAARRSR